MSSFPAFRNERLASLVRREHKDSGRSGIPFYNEEFGVSQGIPHADMVGRTYGVLRRCIAQSGYSMLADNPIGAIDPETGKQRIFYADFGVLDIPFEMRKSAIMSDLVLVIEIVSTDNKSVAENDIDTKKKLYQFNGVPEFLLIFPDQDDKRILTWYRLDPSGLYREIEPDEKGIYRSNAIEGFGIEVLPTEKWPRGNKMEWARSDKMKFYYRGTELKEADAEYRARIKAEKQAEWAENGKNRAENREMKAKLEKEQAQERAEQAQERAEQAQSRAEQARLEKEQERLEKEQAQLEKEQAQTRAEQAQARAEWERLEKEKALKDGERERLEKERLIALIRKAGLED